MNSRIRISIVGDQWLVADKWIVGDEWTAGNEWIVVDGRAEHFK